MAELDLTTIAASSISTPGSGVLATYADLTSKLLSTKNDAGVIQTLANGIKNQAVTTVAGYAADTYLVGSSIAIPSGQPIVGARYHCVFDVTKTAAGVAAPVLIIRFGTAGSTADAAICTFTFNAQTAVVDNGVFEVWSVFRTVGAGTSAVLQGMSTLHHNLAVTGLGSVNPVGWQQVLVTSAGFNSTVASSIIGLSVNGGAAAAWTTTLVQAELAT